MRLVDADKLLEREIVVSDISVDGVLATRRMIPLEEVLKAPTIELDVRGHGEWLAVKTDRRSRTAHICSDCKNTTNGKPNYCPRCGACMDNHT